LFLQVLSQLPKSLSPIAWFSFKVRNRKHADVIALYPIDELIREVFEKQAARIP